METEILDIVIDNNSQFVDARKLHEALGVGRDFSTWIKDRILKYGFIEGKDFSSKRGESIGGRPPSEYLLSVQMAKELAVVENSDQGRKVRKYLIKIEDAWNSPEMVMQRALQFSQMMVDTMQKRLFEAEKTVELQKPKALYYDALVERNNSTSFRDTAKELNIPEKKFIQSLLDDKYIYRDPKRRLCAQAEHVKAGLFELKEWQAADKAGVQTLVTVKGKDLFLSKYAHLQDQQGDQNGN